MIRVMNSSLNRLGVIRNVIKASRVEQLNGENTLAFEAILDITLNSYINPETIFELRGDYLDVAMYEKIANEDGTFTVSIEAEQVSYRLNEAYYNVTDFEKEGTPNEILSLILSGTGFTTGVVEFADIMKYEAGGEVSRRQLLMQFATALKGELVFNKFTISIVRHRGSTERVPIVKDQHVKIVSQRVDKRNLTPSGHYSVIYDCESLYLPSDHYLLGDEIKLMERRLSIFEELRVVSITYNPYNEMDTSFIFATGPLEYYGRGIERVIQEQSTAIAPSVDEEVIDDKINERFDDLFDERFNKRINEVFIFDKDQAYFINPVTGERRPLGGVSSEIITETIITEIIEAGTVLTSFIFAESGVIANAMVRRLRTDLAKPWMYLNKDTSDIHYQDIGDTPDSSGRYFKVDINIGGVTEFFIPAIDERFAEVPVYWFNGDIGGAMTINPRFGRRPMTREELGISPDEEIDPDILFSDPIPVQVFEYKTTIIHRSEARKTDEGWWGIRDQWGSGVDSSGRGAGIIEKTDTYMFFGMQPGEGKEIGGYRVSIENGPEYWDKESETWQKPGTGSIEGGSDVVIERLI